MKAVQKQGAFVSALWDWFARHKRTLPWRDLQEKDASHRAYLVLVSEVMLQQTQVSRVHILFKRFLEQFPTAAALAKASNKDVLLAWRGLGYNSRALRLRDAAKEITEQHRGVFPQELDQLLRIKGIGAYTAAAIRNFAFGLPTVCIDTNIRRILHRVFIGPEQFDTKKGVEVFETSDRNLFPITEEVLNLAIRTAPKKNCGAQDWHAALMDFGSLVCTKRSPQCSLCPEQKICSSAFKIDKAKKRTNNLIIKKEPGRMLGGKYIPNRIFRGRIVEALRDAHTGLPFERIGSEICVDWNVDEHRVWLEGLLDGLIRDSMVMKHHTKYELAK